MRPEIYTNAVLTVIAICVVWLSVKDIAITAAAGAGRAGEQVMALKIVTV
jgi:hypothetical protein